MDTRIKLVPHSSVGMIEIWETILNRTDGTHKTYYVSIYFTIFTHNIWSSLVFTMAPRNSNKRGMLIQDRFLTLVPGM